MINYTIRQINYKGDMCRMLHAFDTRESMRNYLNRPSHQKIKSILYFKRKNRLLVRPNNRGSV